MGFWHPRTGGLVVLAAVIAVLPAFLANAFYYDVIILVGINAIVCVGLNLLIGYAGQISLGHAAFFGLGGYFSTVLSGTYDWPPLAAMLTGAVAVGGLSFVVARPILKLRGHYLAMGTLGLGIIISIALNREVGITGVSKDALDEIEIADEVAGRKKPDFHRLVSFASRHRDIRNHEGIQQREGQL